VSYDGCQSDVFDVISYVRTLSVNITRGSVTHCVVMNSSNRWCSFDDIKRTVTSLSTLYKKQTTCLSHVSP